MRKWSYLEAIPATLDSDSDTKMNILMNKEGVNPSKYVITSKMWQKNA